MLAMVEPVTLEPRGLIEAAAMIRVLGHPIRLRIVECLEAGEQTVSALQARLRVPQAIVSQQLAKMRAGGIVRCRREGSSVWYRVADERVLRVLDCLRHGRTGRTGQT